MANRINAANHEAFLRMDKGSPELVDIVYAKDVLTDIDKYTIGHAGPPISWEEMCDPMRGAVIGAVLYEGLADTHEQAVSVIESGRVKLRHNHSVGSVGPMTGIITYSMPLIKVVNTAFGNTAYCTINEGLGKVMRFGANGPEVIGRLKWFEEVLGPALKKLLQQNGPINLKVLMSKALAMGDEMHQRNIAASALFIREIVSSLTKIGLSDKDLTDVTTFLAGNEQFFLNLAMAACKSIADTIRDIPDCSLVSAMSRNGKNFAIKVSGLGDQWFEAPCLIPEGLYFPGYNEADSNPDMGDSAICETCGIGGFAMGTAPAVVRFVGANSSSEAVAYTCDMFEITEGESTCLLMPGMDFRGIPVGIDIRKVVETGILPVINTGIAHKDAGVGQIGAGIVNAPMDCFVQALVAFAEKMGV